MSTELEVADLRSRVVRLEAQVEFLYKRLNVEYMEDSSFADAKVIETLKTRNLIEAIKVYREIHDVGLAEAKNAVERIKARLGL
ncbi:MAG: hypothetical protein HZB19_05735 [Chloroflexi bacterium]|nr:hypothetical protein [Chloroflexota bacterium]